MTIVSAWLLTFVIHAVALLALATLLDVAVRPLRIAWRETLWRAALFGGLLTASAQMISTTEPFAGRWNLLSAPLAAGMPSIASRPDSPLPGGSGAIVARPMAASAHDSRARTAPPTAPFTVAAPVAAAARDWTAYLLGAWLAGAFVALARAARAMAQLRRALARAQPLVRRDTLAEGAALARRVGIAMPRLQVLDELGGPIAAPGRRIVLPRWAVDALDADQLRAMLAHELGHVVRRDPEWKIAIALWRAAWWFLPPVAFAQRRLDALAELACDAFAAQHTGDARGLALCLATCAERQLRGQSFDLAPAMAGHSPLVERVERLLDGVHLDTSASGALSRSLAAIVLAAAVFCLPAVGVDAALLHAAGRDAPAPPAPPAPPAAPSPPAAAAAHGHSSISIHSDDSGDSISVSLSDATHKFSAKIDGKIAFTDDEADIASLSAGGRASFEETRDGVRRKLELVDRDGRLERHYFVEDSEQPIGSAARNWTASIVKQLERSGIGAEERVRRLYAHGGANTVLDEIAQLPTDYVRGVYLRVLVGLGTLDPAQLERALQLAGALQSDYERRQALTAVFDQQALDAGTQVAFLRQALRFDSDYERAELLIGALPRLAGTADVRQAWLDAALKVNSDYERRRTLESMLTRGGLDDRQLAAVIEASNSIRSDYEHRELLVATAQHARDLDAVAPAYVRSAQKIASDYEHREALLALLRSGKIGVPGANAVLDSAAQIHSSYECRELLVALAGVMPADAALHARYREVAQKLPDYERSEAERALVR